MFELVEAMTSYNKRSYGIGCHRGSSGEFYFGRSVMEPVIGLDVAKGSSVFQAFLRRNESYGKTENVTHDERGFKRLGELVTELRELTGIEPVIILEATGHYHRGLVSFFTREEN
jgi:hypothetical protein